MGNRTNLTLEEQSNKEEIKNLMFLIQKRHLLDQEAGQILHQYNGYLNNNCISLFDYVYALYGNKD